MVHTSNSLTSSSNDLFFLQDSSKTFKALSKFEMYSVYIYHIYMYNRFKNVTHITFRNGAMLNKISPILGLKSLYIYGNKWQALLKLFTAVTVKFTNWPIFPPVDWEDHCLEHIMSLHWTKLHSASPLARQDYHVLY